MNKNPLPIQFRKTIKHKSFWNLFSLVGELFANDEGKIAGFGCVGLISFVSLIVFINNHIIDYVIWFITGHHLPTWMNVVCGLFLAAASILIWVIGFICLALQHLNIFPVPIMQ